MADHPKGAHPQGHEAPPKSFVDRITDTGMAFERKRHELTEAVGKSYRHLTGADAPKHEGPGTMTKVVDGFERHGRETREAIEGAGAPRHDAYRAKLDRTSAHAEVGVRSALQFAEKHVGSHLDKLADPRTGPVECAREMKALASELKPSTLANNAVKEYVGSKVDAFVRNQEAHSETFSHAVHDIEVAKGGREQAQHLKKDLAGMRTELAAAKAALGKHEYASAAMHTEKLAEKTIAFEKDLAAAKKFVHEAKLEPLHAQKHLHGDGGHLHTHGATNPLLAGATTAPGARGDAAPGANVTPSPLSEMRVGDHASIGRHRDGSFEISSQSQNVGQVQGHGQPHPGHQPQHQHAGR